MLVRDRMISAGKRVSATLPITSLIETSDQSAASWLPVVDQEGRLIGILTRSDIQKVKEYLVSEKNDSDKKLFAQDFARTNFLFVTENTPIEEATRIMIDYNVSDLPVVKDGFYTGIITEKILLRVLMEITAARRQGVRLTVQLENKSGSLLTLLELIRDQQGTIHGLCTYCAVESEYMITTMRVEGVDKYSLKQALRASGHTVIDIR